MALPNITVDRQLRLLLQRHRHGSGLTQAQAALLAGIDPSWWKKLESGRRTGSDIYTVARMCLVVGVPFSHEPGEPDTEVEMTYPALARQMKLTSNNSSGARLNSDRAEIHLALTPDTSPEERQALILLLRKIRKPGSRPDPYSQHLRKLLRTESHEEQ